MSLQTIVSADMSVAQMRTLAGKTRSKGAADKSELLFAVYLTLAEREAALDQLPAETQKKLRGSPVAQRELKRCKMASAGECSNWLALRSVLEFFPPSILLHVLSEEMTAAQMKKVAGVERTTGASTKDELVFGVLLALATRGPKALRDLPAAALTRIEAAPAALDWVKLLERADTDFLASVTTGLEFRELLCKPRDGCDGADEEEDDDEEEEVDDDDELVIIDDHGEEAATKAAARVVALEAELATAKAEADTAKASRVRTRTGGADPKKLEFGTANELETTTGAAAKASRSVVVSHPVAYWLLAAEMVASMLLPALIILAVIATDASKMPGKPGDDLRIHALAR